MMGCLMTPILNCTWALLFSELAFCDTALYVGQIGGCDMFASASSCEAIHAEVGAIHGSLGINRLAARERLVSNSLTRGAL